MRTTLGTTLATALLTLISANAGADAGHSLEADQHDERAEGVQARSKASVRVRWQDSAGRGDPRVAVKLLGINDFHGQLSARTVGPRPAGGAAVLASYLQTAAEQAAGPAFIIHAGDHVGATPPNSALCRMSRRSTCSISWRTSGAFLSSCSASSLTCWSHTRKLIAT
jgi:2',3'-cyclic-nucleotide 2'-phosphodiesterase (5'-nucleotidase family)